MTYADRAAAIVLLAGTLAASYLTCVLIDVFRRRR